MSQQTSNSRRQYKNEPYLRAEHLLVNGRYVATKKKIVDIVYGCPKKKMGSTEMAQMIGLAFPGTDKILGLCATNESLIAWICGDGDPQKWIGREIMLCVRLAGNTKEPAIRIWPGKGRKHPNNRVSNQMGDEINDSWYASHSPLDHTEAAKAQAAENQQKHEKPQDNAAVRVGLIDKLTAMIMGAKGPEELAGCEANLNGLKAWGVKHGMPLSDDESSRFESMLAATQASWGNGQVV